MSGFPFREDIFDKLPSTISISESERAVGSGGYADELLASAEGADGRSGGGGAFRPEFVTGPPQLVICDIAMQKMMNNVRFDKTSFIAPDAGRAAKEHHTKYGHG